MIKRGGSFAGWALGAKTLGMPQRIVVKENGVPTPNRNANWRSLSDTQISLAVSGANSFSENKASDRRKRGVFGVKPQPCAVKMVGMPQSHPATRPTTPALLL